MSRQARLAEFIENNVANIYEMEGATSGERFLLVECSIHDHTLFLTTFATPEDAAAYHDGQEEPDSWPIHQLIDLDTGTVLQHETRYVTTFTEVPA